MKREKINIDDNNYMDDIDITKIRLSIAELAHDIETIIRLNPQFLLSTDASKRDIIRAFKDQMEKTGHHINLYLNDVTDQYLIFLAIRILEMRRIIKAKEDWSKD